ncbi:hypothetical protein F441_14204 [Phytophthora nicotianae CJ01A1]|uniref:Uncharacterized protein n=4 Tax=Phytophthora nicotianae TaxID=4792 RepID=V9EQ98_PHYNI|nr:hypothetical protein F443_14310 [Phytophthora nicotianae P1569]ETK80356.1 hypothetical protein L915_13950 [Phytophthora nicotianae]ETO82728.1 hypothetical protein F444_03159 [Phytophthora nicotianae P1976]ETP10075.1 hypothetical protein F441_14204 [Phytophthora nicotianae CJ01A1]
MEETFAHCGVYVAHWFDYYTMNYLLESDNQVVLDTPPLTKRELELCRYKIFCYVFYGMSVNLTE